MQAHHKGINKSEAPEGEHEEDEETDGTLKPIKYNYWHQKG